MWWIIFIICIVVAFAIYNIVLLISCIINRTAALKKDEKNSPMMNGVLNGAFYGGRGATFGEDYSTLVQGLINEYGYELLRNNIQSVLLRKNENRILKEVGFFRSIPNIDVVFFVNHAPKKTWSFAYKTSANDMLTTIKADMQQLGYI